MISGGLEMVRLVVSGWLVLRRVCDLSIRLGRIFHSTASVILELVMIGRILKIWIVVIGLLLNRQS